MDAPDRYSIDEEKVNVTVICDDPMMVELIREVGASGSLHCENLPSLTSLLSLQPYSEISLNLVFCVDLRTKMSGTDSELIELALFCERYGTRLVVVTDLDRIDSLYGLLPEDSTQFVIGDDAPALLMALTVAKRASTPQALFDNSKDQNSPALSKISAELAEFARALSRIAEADDNGDIGADYLADKPRSYKPPSGVIAKPFTSGTASAAEASLDPHSIRALIRVRRLRDRFFQGELFADPAWDILLDLMASRLEGTNVSVSSLCIAAAVPSTTALRWIKSMTEDGYLERRADPTDARRVYIHLSDSTAQKMAQYLHARAEVSAI